jgi:hypothetical protein
MRPLALALGVASLVAGLALAATGAAGGLVTRVGFVLAALAAGVGALLALLVRSVEGPETTSLGRPPERPGVRRPGDRLDRKLAAAERGETPARDALHERAEGVAVDALVRHSDRDRAAARDLLRRGEWPDDAVAAALFADRRSRPSLRDRVRVLLGGESTFRQRFGRATAALWERYR